MGTLLDIFRSGGIMNKTGMKGKSFQADFLKKGGIMNATGMKGVSFTSPKVMPEQPEQPQQPVVDSSNAMGSLAELMGPTPAEREAQIRKAQEGKAKMAAWTGLFDGLRHLGNLYYTARGASPQQFTDPMQQVDAQYQEQMKLADQMANYSKNYNQVLYNMKRQAELDKLNKDEKLAHTRYWDSLAGAKDDAAETARARTENIKTRTENLKRLAPLNEEKARALIRKYNHDAGRPYRTKDSTTDPFEELATHLQNDPDRIGPILQQEGLGFYDPDTKEFTFIKNATKGMATTANRRTIQQQVKGNSGGKDYSRYKSNANQKNTTKNNYDKYKKSK